MKRLQHNITTGRYTLPVSIFLTLICWIGIYIYMPRIPLSDELSYPFWQYLEGNLPAWGERIVSLLFCFIIGFFLIQFNNYFAIIRRRASVQTSIFLLFVTACPMLHVFHPTDIAIVMVLFGIYNLFRSYQCQRPAGYIFNAFVFLGIGSLILPQLLWFVPMFLIGIILINTLNLRTFIAAILGCSLPYWFLWAYAFYTDNMELFYQPFKELVNFPAFNFDSISLRRYVILAYFFIVYAVCSVFCFTNKNKDKIRTRAILRFIILLCLGIFLYSFLQPDQSMNMLLLLLAGISILAAHFLVLTNSKASNLFFICALIGLLLLFLFNIWMLL